MITNEDQDGLKVWAEIESDLHFAELMLSLKTETRSDVQRAVKLKGAKVDDEPEKKFRLRGDQNSRALLDQHRKPDQFEPPHLDQLWR